ncbi:MAG: ATP-binding protein [Fibrobacter sp.]|nr:ATP-binding protein [Fibrobacter sp.]
MNGNKNMSSLSLSQLSTILTDFRESARLVQFVRRSFEFENYGCYVFVGVRRAGKSYLMFQRMNELVSQGVDWDDIVYVNFEDERLIGFDTEDFNKILEVQYSRRSAKPYLFLDEVQNVPGWHKFVRRLADSKHIVYVTGSNAKMLSGDIATTLGGRYLIREVYPFSFREFLDAKGAQLPALQKSSIAMSTAERGRLEGLFEQYFLFGGFPESLAFVDRRSYVSSVFQKIYLGDVIARNGITNVMSLKVMLKKLAESVKQPVSFNRVCNIVGACGVKVGINTIISFIGACSDSWLLLPLRNYTGKLVDKETKPKYYFVDNGILSLLLVDPTTTLLENMVALSLFRRYGHDLDNERVFFYGAAYEVDFYVPEDELAVQVSFAIGGDETTFEREVSALSKLPKVLPCRRRVVVTYGEECSLRDSYGEIEVLPCWKWLLD